MSEPIIIVGAGQAGIKSVVCLSEHVAAYRVEMIKALGAEVSLKGHSQDEAEKNYQLLMASRGLVPVVPFDDPLIIAGQGTITLEILSNLPDTDILMIQLSGGGLLAGMAPYNLTPGIQSIKPLVHNHIQDKNVYTIFSKVLNRRSAIRYCHYIVSQRGEQPGGQFSLVLQVVYY